MSNQDSNLKIFSTQTTITLEESLRNLPLNLIGDKGTIISTLSDSPSPELGSGRVKYPNVQKIYGSGRTRSFVPDSLSLRFDMVAADMSAKEVATAVKGLVQKNLGNLGGEPLSSHTDWTNGHYTVEIKLPRTEESLKAAHRLIAFYKEPQYDMAKQLSL